MLGPLRFSVAMETVHFLKSIQRVDVLFLIRYTYSAKQYFNA